MAEEKQELKKCSQCKCVQLLQYFDLNRKGEHFRTCNRCRLKKFKCGQCEKTFVQKSNLCKHIQCVHEKLKPFACSQCNATFGQKSNLRKHIQMVHEKLKPFTCDQCDATFGQKSDLRKHIQMVHEKLKPFTCDQCDATFGQKSDLRKHIKTVHEKLKPFTCDQCDATFGKKSNRRKHIKICTGSLNISSGELAVRNALDAMKLEYKTEVSALRNDEGNCIRFDFEINYDGKILYIEYDGAQHFKPQRFGGMTKEDAQAAFEKLQLHDQQKNQWCNASGHPLLRIPYTKFGEVPQLITEFITSHTDWGVE